VLGDFGTASKAQYQLAEQMVKLHERFKYGLVVLVGDNLYGSERPQDFKMKFEIPYKPLLDAGVKFYASLGNHDAREQRYYKPFNMDGNLYYSFNPSPDVRFFILESTYPVPEQIAWLEKELKASNSNWKIPVFHHPLYSSGDRHGSDLLLREVLEPLFVKYNVSVVLTGHDHFYERVKPQKGITYFVVGSGGQLRAGNIDRASGITAKGFDTDQAFMAAEIAGDEMYFNAISRQGQIIDSGVLTRRKATP
jgi:3',5'-cyclic AMP phosphodiesterase CpdA